MRCRASLLVLAGITTWAVSACSGSSATLLTAEQVSEKLSAYECTDLATDLEEDTEGNVYSVVTCELDESGGILVNIVDTTEEFASVRELACRDVPENDEAAQFEVAYGDNWVGLVIAVTGVTTQDLAETLGGKAGTIGDFCA